MDFKEFRNLLLLLKGDLQERNILHHTTITKRILELNQKHIDYLSNQILVRFHVSFALHWHARFINPPRVLEKNVLIPVNVISDECLSHTSSWEGNCCKGGFDEVFIINMFTTAQDRDNQKILCLSSV